MPVKKTSALEPDTLYRITVSEVVMVDGLRIRPNSHANLLGSSAEKIAGQILTFEKVEQTAE